MIPEDNISPALKRRRYGAMSERSGSEDVDELKEPEIDFDGFGLADPSTQWPLLLQCE